MDSEIRNRIQNAFQEAQCFIKSLSSEADHYIVIVVSKSFEGISLLKRHRLIMDLFQKELSTGEIHALSFDALTPQEWDKKQSRV